MTSIRELAKAATPEAAKTEPPSGNFTELSALFDQLLVPPVYPLGYPLPSERHLPKKRAASCPATHNQLLSGDDSA